MVTQIVIAVLLGIVFGLLLFSQAGVHLKIVGDIFSTAHANGNTGIDLRANHSGCWGHCPKELTRLGGKTIAVFGISSLLAAALGCRSGSFLYPGKGIDFHKRLLTLSKRKKSHHRRR